MNGTDVNFGSLTRSLIEHLEQQHGVSVDFGHAVTGLERNNSGWNIHVKNKATGGRIDCSAEFVFLERVAVLCRFCRNQVSRRVRALADSL